MIKALTTSVPGLLRRCTPTPRSRKSSATSGWARSPATRDDFSSTLQSPEGPETCNTYNMLKLSRALFLEHPDAEVLDYYERATVNHVLSSPRGLLSDDAALPEPLHALSSASADMAETAEQRAVLSLIDASSRSSLAGAVSPRRHPCAAAR
ncbi:beta-L-arabinofuranosidase domain-containing protein [Streptomyces sp. HUAS ZL42]|uniref:beta-L-arabinofuranosidase domain-containing protein n=1 Tax=Streptomyces sp. HUAS ZL42 TaxID=3231715 RepID=UPI00345E7D5D